MKYLYSVIYHPGVNKILRAVNKIFRHFTSFKLPPSGIISIRFKSGISFLMATNQTSFVTKLLFYNGPESFEYTTIFEKLIVKCETFFDIGANTGYYTLLAASAHPSIRVYSFEPSGGAMHYLKKNILLNSLSTNVILSPLALGDKIGELDFYAVRNPKYSVAHNLGGVGSLEQKNQGAAIRVKTSTVDEFVSANKITVDILKLDTEGTEDLILYGASATIDKFKPIIICETLFNRIEDKIEGIMLAHQYLFFNHVNGRLQQVDTLIRKEDNKIRDCFMVHPEKLQLIKEFISK